MFSQEVVEFPIAGKVTSVNVSQGTVVAEGDVLCVLESMKMENPIIAPVAGIITEMKISVGQAASAGDLVVVIGYLKE